MNNSEAILLGIISGLITSAILFLLLQVFNKIVLPWFQDIIYSGVRIEGQWYTQKIFKETGTIQDELMEIKQHAYKLSGIYTVTKRIPDTENVELKTFVLEGKIKDGFVHLVSHNTDKTKIGITCSLYKVASGGDSLIGSDIWVDVGSNAIIHQNEHLKRKK